jgi:histidyl-tRNA synthetase
MAFKRPKGTQDLLPADTPRWQWLEAIFRRRCALYGYREIRTPIFESTELFTRGVGEDTDIVIKQMYSFESKGRDRLTLRPEGTATTVRAVIENNLLRQGGIVKLYYLGPIFRYEQPQSGRYRQFHQVGIEAFGAPGPDIDAEILAFAAEFLRDLGIGTTTLELNSVGCPECRPRYRDALRNALSGARTALCPDCTRRYDGNPLRILDCKVETCRELASDVPVMLDVLCDACKAHLLGVEDGLRALGVEYVVNPHIVRGLDYYTRTAFEFVSGALGAQNTVLAGGRYDGLVEELGGPATPGIGFAAGIERLLMAAEDAVPLPEQPGPLFIATLGPVARRAGFMLAERLRRAGIPALTDYGERSVKAQMREANRKGAWYAVVLGENELASNEVALRDMRTSTEERLPLDRLEERLGGVYSL